MQSDPIGLLGGFNPYGYVENPLTWIDYLGLQGCSSQFSGDRGRKKAQHDLERNGMNIVAEEVTMKVNDSRIRADFVAQDGHGNYHIFEVKHGNGRLTPNQKASGVYDLSNPSNNVSGIGGGTILTGNGTQGSFTLSTRNQGLVDIFGQGTHSATFHVLKY